MKARPWPLSYAIKLWSWDFHLSNDILEICDEDKFENPYITRKNEIFKNW